MTAEEIRRKYLSFFETRGHAIIPRASLVPHNDPTTLFTGSGMQPLLPYLLGEPHPHGVKLVDSQTCLRAQDIDDIGDNRHTTFFEMLGNWSLGDYFKAEQIRWFFEFLTDEVGLDPEKIYVSCFIGDEKNGIPRDDEAAQVWQALFQEKGMEAHIVELDTAENGDKKGMQGGRIFFYNDAENWWSRGGGLTSTPIGDPCGPDSEVFYDFGESAHDATYGEPHPASDSGRFMEIGNQVFMQYKRTKKGFEPLEKKNVDFGGGLERIAAAAIDSPDVFKISLMYPIIQKLEVMSQKKYEQHTEAMRVIADHLRAATFMAVDGVTPSNKTQGYVMRRLIRRAMVKALELGIEQNFLSEVVPVIADLYHNDYPEVADNREKVIALLVKEEKAFRQTLRKGLRELKKIYAKNNGVFTGEDLFVLYDTYGYPKELSQEMILISLDNAQLSQNWRSEFEENMQEQRQRSQTASKGTFKGGLSDASQETVKLHTATHLMYRALKDVLGEHVVQRGSNITPERLRFDFSHEGKVSREILDTVEDIVNQKIAENLPVTWQEENTNHALAAGVSGAFGDKYGETVKVYRIGDFSQEICGGPHVEHTSVLAEGGKKFKIMKEEASSAGVRRIKAVLV
jgi:alanyl-tRNA synthetase